MGLVNTSILYDDRFDFSKAAAEDVYFAFIIKMPFRFRVSNGFHCHFQTQGCDYDVWIKNTPVEQSEPGMVLHRLASQGGRLEDLWSTVAIIPNAGRVTLEELNALRSCHGDVEHLALESRTKQLFPAMQALNALIIGYHTATGELLGGHPLQTMTVNEYMNNVAWELALIGIPLTYWTSQTINELFDLKANRELRSVTTLTGDVTDLPDERLSDLGTAIDRLNTFYFYELAFEAKAKMAAGDYLGALLMAVAALEGVHGAFVSHVLAAKLPVDRTGENKNLEEEFVKELGFSLCNKLTPYILMAPNDRPSSELIAQVGSAIKYRNEIMHALRNAAGQYRIRTRTNADLCDAYSAALQLYEVYRRAFENALSQQRLEGPTDSLTGSVSDPTRK